MKRSSKPKRPPHYGPGVVDRGLFSPRVATAEMPLDLEPGSPAAHALRELFPEEAQHIRKAVEKRRREFAAGRCCARRALAELGFAAQALPAGSGRDPQWPAGAVGGISHKENYCVAIAAKASEVVGLGVDVEYQEDLPKHLWPSILTEPETNRWEKIACSGLWTRVIFSAKESLYKCQYPLTGAWLGFHDVEISLEVDFSQTEQAQGAFEVTFLRQPPEGLPAETIRGRLAVGDGLIFTAIELPAPECGH